MTEQRADETIIAEREERLRRWFTQDCDPLQKAVDSLDIGWGGVQRWATARMPAIGGRHLDIACGYATFLAQLGWRFPAARLVGLNLDFAGPHALARPLLEEAGVAAELVQADARRLPFSDRSFASASCFLGLQDVEIGFGEEGVCQTIAEAVRVLYPDGVLTLLDEFPFERFEVLLDGLPVTVIDQARQALDVRWEREVAERAIALYAEGWAAQARLEDESAREQARHRARSRMAAEMERQLAIRGHYVPFGPVRSVIARRRTDASP
jgi:ubiquinone/menaquinone biosynthesis C-methylase UbiE